MMKFGWTKKDLQDAKDDQEVMQWLVEENYAFLYKQCVNWAMLQFVQTDAREYLGVATEVFMRCVRKSKGYRTKGQFLAYCKIAIRHRFIQDLQIRGSEDFSLNDVHHKGWDNLVDHNIERMIEMEQIHYDTERFLSVLSEREREVIERHFGLNGHTRQQQVEIARRMNITKQCIHDIVWRAIYKMRRAANGELK